MAETAITTVLAKVAELVAWEAAVLLEVGDDVRLLRDKLEWLHTFIRDADRRRRLRDDEFVAVWVRQTRDVAFEAEDALDDFLHRAGRHRRRRNPPPALPTGARCSAWRWRWQWQWPRRPRCAGLQVALRHDLSARVRQIRKRLDEISANRAAYNIEHAPAPTWAASSATTLAAWYVRALPKLKIKRITCKPLEHFAVRQNRGLIWSLDRVLAVPTEFCVPHFVLFLTIPLCSF
jgi:hypothetical protein